MKFNKKRSKTQTISNSIKKFLNSKYTTKEKILQKRLEEVQATTPDSSINIDNYLDKLNSLEPVFHLYENYFIAFNEETFKYGVVDTVREQLIVPCDYSEIYRKENKGEVLITFVDLSCIESTYKASELKEIFKHSVLSKSEIIKEIAVRNNFSTAVDITKTEKAV